MPGVRVMHVAPALLDASFVSRLHDAGYLVHAANCETEEDLGRAYELGVDRLGTKHLRTALAARPS